MSYRDNLYTFLTVYRHGSQQKAALELNLTQPAISQHIKILEHYIGKDLFYKKGRSLVPTPIAHQLMIEVRDTFNKLDSVLHNLKSTNETLSGTVYLGGISEFFAKIMLPRLSSLNDYDIRLRFEADYTTLEDRLLSGEIDLAHFTSHVVHPNIAIEKLYHQEFVLIGHPKFKKRISAKQLQNNNISILNELPWIAYSETLLFINEYFHTVFNQQFDAPVKLFVKDLWAILEGVSAGFGISIMPSYFCDDYIRNKKVCVLYQPKNGLSIDFYLGWKHGAQLDPKVDLVKQLLLNKIKN